MVRYYFCFPERNRSLRFRLISLFFFPFLCSQGMDNLSNLTQIMYLSGQVEMPDGMYWLMTN